jgi:phosphoserine phosphatase
MIVSDPLPSWNNRPAKAAVLAFVSAVTEPGSQFVPPTERIATFDNDGTLWCEKPGYVQAEFVFRRWRAMDAADPALAAGQPYKALVENDRAWLAGLMDHVPELVKGVTEAWSDITTGAFDDAVSDFFATAAHPTLGIPYSRTGFRPMRELLDLLRAHAFRVFICSAGGRDFVRNIAEALYGVPRENVIGSGTTLEYRAGAVYRTKGIEQPIDDGPGKPVHIWMRTGRAPLLAAGNADGDIAMLETARFGLLVHHDDGDREFAYDSGAGHALAEAGTRGWTVVSMKDDWTTVF